MSIKTLLIGAAAAALAWFFIRRIMLYDHEVQKASGVQAAMDAQASGYTTYNTQLYTPPLFRPILRFFKAGAYVASPLRGTGSTDAQPVGYSVQG